MDDPAEQPPKTYDAALFLWLGGVLIAFLLLLALGCYGLCITRHFADGRSGYVNRALQQPPGHHQPQDPPTQNQPPQNPPPQYQPPQNQPPQYQPTQNEPPRNHLSPNGETAIELTSLPPRAESGSRSNGLADFPSQSILRDDRRTSSTAERNSSERSYLSSTSPPSVGGQSSVRQDSRQDSNPSSTVPYSAAPEETTPEFHDHNNSSQNRELVADQTPERPDTITERLSSSRSEGSVSSPHMPEKPSPQD